MTNWKSNIFWVILIGAIIGLILGCIIADLVKSPIMATIFGAMLGGALLALSIAIFWLVCCPKKETYLLTEIEDENSKKPLL